MKKNAACFKFAVLLLLIAISLFSCQYSIRDAKKHLPGQFIYQIPSGEVQILTINPDFTFKQILYSKNGKDILYENMGKMYIDRDEIKFENWLEFYELGRPKMTSKPRLGNSIGNVWRKPRGNDDVLIIVNDDIDYIFRKKNILGTQ